MSDAYSVDARRGAAPRSYLVLHTIVLVIAFAAVLVWGRPQTDVITTLWPFILLGIVAGYLGATTGAGGSVFWVPFLLLLAGGTIALGPVATQVGGWRPETVLGTALLIECFGLSAAMMSWIYGHHVARVPMIVDRITGHDMLATIGPAIAFALPGVLITEIAVRATGWLSLADVRIPLIVYAVLFLAVVITLVRTREEPRTEIGVGDSWALMALGAAGGFATGQFGIGAGALVTLYLIARQLPAGAAVLAGVIVSLAAAILGFLLQVRIGNVAWGIAVMTIPGALVGGALGRVLMRVFGPLVAMLIAGGLVFLMSVYLILGSRIGTITIGS